MTPIFPLIPFRRIFTPLRHSRALKHRRLRPVSNGNGMSPVDVFVPPINPCKHNKAWLNQDDGIAMEHVTFPGSDSWIPRSGSSGLAHTHIPTSRPPIHLLGPAALGISNRPNTQTPITDRSILHGRGVVGCVDSSGKQFISLTEFYTLQYTHPAHH